jgi:hypothetical protein
MPGPGSLALNTIEIPSSGWMRNARWWAGRRAMPASSNSRRSDSRRTIVTSVVRRGSRLPVRSTKGTPFQRGLSTQARTATNVSTVDAGPGTDRRGASVHPAPRGQGPQRRSNGRASGSVHAGSPPERSCADRAAPRAAPALADGRAPGRSAAGTEPPATRHAPRHAQAGSAPRRQRSRRCPPAASCGRPPGAPPRLQLERVQRAAYPSPFLRAKHAGPVCDKDSASGRP